MNPMNRREAVREALANEAGAADALVVKPAGAIDEQRAVRESIGAINRADGERPNTRHPVQLIATFRGIEN
jgi:delta-aminolevulinic acid dehydratase/porphobilinogen synthase